MNLEVRHLHLVKAIAEDGTISKASDRLHLTQSALSHQLRDIEQKLGAQLFLRHNKRMTLSQAGKRLLNSVGVVLDELGRAEEEVQRIALEKEGLLRISTECYTCYHWLPSVLKVFHNKFPNVDVQVVTEATTGPIQYILDGKLDLAIITGPLRNRRIVLEPLFQDKMFVIMSPLHPLAKRAYINPEDFADQHVFLYSLPMEENTYYEKVLSPAGIQPKKITQIRLTEAIIEMVKAGLGIAVLAYWAIEPEVKQRTLKALPLTRKGFTRDWSAAMLKNGPVPSYLSSFIKLLANRKMPAMKYY